MSQPTDNEPDLQDVVHWCKRRFHMLVNLQDEAVLKHALVFLKAFTAMTEEENPLLKTDKLALPHVEKFHEANSSSH